MIRYGRRNAVVPIMERIVEDDLISESDEERLIHFPFGFIHLVHNLSKDFQTFLCHGICSPAAGISDGEEWSSAPRAGYLGEEAVFNGVELGAVGRVVHDEDPHAKAVGKIHEVLLEEVEKFINSLGNGIWRTSKSLAYSPYRASFGTCGLACNKMPSIAFFKCCKVFHFRLANFNWRFLLHHCKMNCSDMI